MYSYDHCIKEVMDRSEGRCEFFTYHHQKGICRCEEREGSKAVQFKGVIRLYPFKINKKSDVDPENYRAFCWYHIKKQGEKNTKKKKTKPMIKNENQTELF